jgi:UDP-N-acetylglucosamine 2-epimerase
MGREHAANVVDVPADRSAIRDAVAHALNPAFRRSIRGLESPYGDGGASKIIVRTLVRTPLGARLLFKNTDLS